MKISVKKLVLFCSALFAIVAFFLMFADPVGVDTKFAGIQMSTFDYVYFGKESAAISTGIKGAWTSVVGFALILLSGIALMVLTFVKAKHVKLIYFVAFLALIVGAILVLLTKTLWLALNNASDYAEMYVLGAGPIIAGVLAILSAMGIVVSGLIKK